MPGGHGMVFVISVSESAVGIPCVSYQSSVIDTDPASTNQVQAWSSKIFFSA